MDGAAETVEACWEDLGPQTVLRNASSIVYGLGIVPDDGPVTYATGRRARVRLDPSAMRPAGITRQFPELARPLTRRAVAGTGDAADDDALAT